MTTLPTRARAHALIAMSLCQGLLTGAVLVAQTLGTLEVRRLGDSVSLAGSALALQLLGAVIALLLVRRRERSGMAVIRLVGLGFGGMSIGALLSAAAIMRASLPGLLAGSAIFGAGAACALLLRAWATEIFDRPRRGWAIGVVAVGGVAGSVAAPLVVHLSSGTGTSGGSVMPWLVVAMGAGLAALLILTAPRVTPKRRHDAPVRITSPRGRRNAIGVCVVAGMAMVAMMSTATLQLNHLGARDGVVATVVAAHYAAMFGCAVPFGVLADRVGRRAALATSALLLMASGVAFASDPHGSFTIAVALALVGAGWSGAFVTGTATLADMSDPAGRTALLARNDLLVAIASALSAMVATSLFAGGGAPLVGSMVVLVAIPAVLAARRVPGRPLGR